MPESTDELLKQLDCFKYAIKALGQIAKGEAHNPEMYAAARLMDIWGYELEWHMVGGKPDNK